MAKTPRQHRIETNTAKSARILRNVGRMLYLINNEMDDKEQAQIIIERRAERCGLSNREIVRIYNDISGKSLAQAAMIFIAMNHGFNRPTIEEGNDLLREAVKNIAKGLEHGLDLPSINQNMMQFIRPERVDAVLQKLALLDPQAPSRLLSGRAQPTKPTPDEG